MNVEPPRPPLVLRSNITMLGVVLGYVQEVASSKEVLELLRQGNANRRTEATGANQVSSRSHAVLQVVVTRTVDDSMGRKSVRESKLSLIDLAG